MKFTAPFATALRLFAIVAILGTSSLSARTDRVLKTTQTQSLETAALIRLLEEWHYNREGVKVKDYDEVIPDYMTELDGQRLFFLQSDKDEFARRYPTQWLYNNVASLGKLDPAFSIFEVYEDRVQARVSWVLEELKKEVDLTAPEAYTVDRSKLPWSADAAAADDLWRKRIKFEIIQEMLNKKTLEDAKQSVRKRYERLLKNLDDIESADITEMFLSTIARLYDPHSTYFSADTYEDFGIQMRLQLVGIGALLGLEDDYCVVKEIITGGPADLSKQLHPNDKIISVVSPSGESVEVIGMKLRKIVDMIRGQKGTQVKMMIQPADATDPSVRREIVLTRDVVNLNSARARGAIFDVPDSAGKITPIGVITLPAFYGPDSSSEGAEKNSATNDVRELIHRLQAAGVQALVLDLRHNGGGLLSEAIDLTGLFVKQGPVVQVKNYYGEVKVDSDENPSIEYTGPLAVLVSRFSASASEIVAGALQNYGRAIVIGDSSTHGKGSVQTIIEMKNLNSSLVRSPVKTGATKLTVQKFYLPNGHSTQLKGVVPDIILPSIDDYLPVGEKDLPHALVWDEIPTSFFDGKPLDPRVVGPLRAASVARQDKLEEFAYLKKTIDWFKTKQEQKTVSLSLEDRKKEKEADTAFRKQMDAEKERLEKDHYAFKEFLLGPPKEPKPKPTKKPDGTGDPADDIDLSTDDDNPAKLDVHLRETLRVLTDAVDMAPKKELWASDHAPLTAATTGGS
ncbi:MAG TPA: carboxy terminal-processing peptidase [Opitutaceae bacterium]|nr:carboxy terminal-processing peptidase [Opitutaceae bacterium]